MAMVDESPSEAPGTSLPVPTTTPYLVEPLADLAAWTGYFRQAQMPILAATALALEELRAKEDDVDAGMLAALIETDPLMTLKLMALVASRRQPGEVTDTETVVSSLVMMGVSPFFRLFGVQPTVEDQLHDQPKALEGLYTLLTRAKRAGHFALGFAVHRGDTDAGVIQQAAFLHDFAEMLMWCHAPTLVLEIRDMQRVNPTLRSANLQRFVFNIDFDDLRQALMTLWHLPALLVRISDGKHPDHPIVRNVLLAVRLARHTAHGWDNAALPDDFNDVAQLLNVAPRAARGFVYKIDQGRE
jgi:HD-like signal output (HDOD) protein